jgi:hypothetical protein
MHQDLVIISSVQLLGIGSKLTSGVQILCTPQLRLVGLEALGAITPEAYKFVVRHGYGYSRGVQHICTPRVY